MTVLTRSILVAAAIFCCAAWAQEPLQISREDVRSHNLGARAIVHSKAWLDQFPPAAVTLQVEVDEAGNLTSVKAIAGPRELWAAAESRETKRKFKPFERNGKPVRVTFEDYVSIMPPEQWSDARTPFPEIKDWNSLKIELRRTVCYGSCPDYSLEVGGTGAVEFEGNSHVLITGHHRATLTQEAIRNLYEAFRQANFLSLKDKYIFGVTDSPTYVTTLAFDSVRKSVVDYVGVQVGMPDAVTEVEAAIDRLAASEKWVHGDPTTGPALLAEKWDFHSTSEENLELFSNVVTRGSPELVKLFVSNGAPVLGTTKEGESPLINAAQKGDLALVKTLCTVKLRCPARPCPAR